MLTNLSDRAELNAMVYIYQCSCHSSFPIAPSSSFYLQRQLPQDTFPISSEGPGSV